MNGYIVARIWFCGDEQCACYQPRLEQVSPNLEEGPPWVRKTLWVGTLASTGEGWPEGVTYDSLVEELRESAKAQTGFVWWNV